MVDGPGMVDGLGIVDGPGIEGSPWWGIKFDTNIKKTDRATRATRVLVGSNTVRGDSVTIGAIAGGIPIEVSLPRAET
jgi:hypothetical protein